MKIDYNDFYFNEAEIAHINKIREKHINMDDFLFEAFQYIETLGVRVEFEEIPWDFRLEGEFGAGWYGKWKGSYTNLIDKNELYSGEPIFDGNWCWGRKKKKDKPLKCVMVGNSGSGGGGSSFSYDNGFIAIETLPKLKKRMFVELEIEKATQDLNVELKSIEQKYNSDTQAAYDKKLEESEDFKYLELKIKQICDLEAELQDKKRQIKQNAKLEAELESAVELPHIEDSLLDLSYYHKVKKTINYHEQTKLKVIDLSATANKIYTVIDEFPHKFL